jgi:hypothetical protein
LRCSVSKNITEMSMAVNRKMHVSEQKFNVRKWKTMRLDESYRLVTTVLVLNSYCGKIYNIFLRTISAAARCVSFFLLPLRRGSSQFSTTMDIYAMETALWWLKPWLQACKISTSTCLSDFFNITYELRLRNASFVLRKDHVGI